MDEFEFLDKQFRRLTEARGLRHHDEKILKKGHSAFETAELMVEGCIRDYLELKKEKK